jgi:hypothetical protein
VDLMTKVKEIKHVYKTEEVNSFFKKGWILLEVASNPSGVTYVIGRILDDNGQQ